jgi:hypothetical protein
MRTYGDLHPIRSGCQVTGSGTTSSTCGGRATCSEHDLIMCLPLGVGYLPMAVGDGPKKRGGASPRTGPIAIMRLDIAPRASIWNRECTVRLGKRRKGAVDTLDSTEESIGRAAQNARIDVRWQ